MFGSSFAAAANAGAAGSAAGGTDATRTTQPQNNQDPMNMLNNMFAGMNATTVSLVLHLWNL